MGVPLETRLGEHFTAREFMCHDGSVIPNEFYGGRTRRSDE